MRVTMITGFWVSQPHRAGVCTAPVNFLALGLFSATEGRLFIRVIGRGRAYSKGHL